MQILWFGRPQGRQMPQCGGERGEKEGGESLDLCSKHACTGLNPSCPAELHPAATPPLNAPIRSCRPLLVHAFVDPAPHSPNSPKLVHVFVDPAPHSPNSPNSPELVHAFVDPAPHSPNSPKPDLNPNCPLPCLVQRRTIH